MTVGLLALCVVLAGPGRLPAVRTISASKQFVVYAEDPLAASAWCAQAETLKRRWLDLLGLRDQWRDPIFLRARDQGPVTLEILTAAEHLQYQIHHPAPVIDPDRLELAIVEALCREFANRHLVVPKNAPAVGARLPLWLFAGLHEMCRGRTDLLLPVVQRCVQAGRPATLAEMAAVRELPADAAAALVYRAQAWALVDGLLAGATGTERVRRFLTGATPPFGADDERWWTLQLAGKLATSLPVALSAEETRAALDDVLRTTITDRAGSGGRWEVPVKELPRYVNQAWFAQLAREKHDGLAALRGRAHPLYAVVVDKYRAAFAAPAARLPALLKQAEAGHASVDAHSRRIAAYVGQVERATGAALPPQPRVPEPERRRDPISDYLDQFDK